MTFLELRQDVFRNLNKNTASPNSDTVTRVNAYLNQRMRSLLAMPGLSKLRDVIFEFTSVADQAHYGFGPGIVDVYRIVDQTNRVVLEERTPAWYREVDPNPTAGTPWTWINYGTQPVFLQPASTATSLVVVSTSASDTNTARIEYLNATAPQYRATGSVVMTGATPATVVTGLTAQIQIAQFRLSVAAVGLVSLYENSVAGTRLAVIEAGQVASRDFKFALWPTPSAAQTYLVEGARALTDMVNDTDVPPLPEDYHSTLSDGASADECLKMDDSRAAYYEGLWAQSVKNIYFRAHGRIVHGGDVDRMYGAPRSRLGSWFPSGS